MFYVRSYLWVYGIRMYPTFAVTGFTGSLASVLCLSLRWSTIFITTVAAPVLPSPCSGPLPTASAPFTPTAVRRFPTLHRTRPGPRPARRCSFPVWRPKGWLEKDAAHKTKLERGILMAGQHSRRPRLCANTVGFSTVLAGVSAWEDISVFWKSRC